MTNFCAVPTGVGMPSITDFPLDWKGMLSNIISQDTDHALASFNPQLNFSYPCDQPLLWTQDLNV